MMREGQIVSADTIDLAESSETIATAAAVLAAEIAAETGDAPTDYAVIAVENGGSCWLLQNVTRVEVTG
jgi:hypothetical protein